MFTGIVADIGTITAIQQNAADMTITVQTQNLDISNSKVGDSIAVNGVCLTAVEIGKQSFTVDISGETLEKTTLAQLRHQSKVNLEMPVTLNTVLGGHLVSGHVDGIAKVVGMQSVGRSERLTFEVAAELSKYIAKKGSVCIDGVSLTINNVLGHQFDVNIIPHTMDHTIFQDYRMDSSVNIEIDIIARYLERLLQQSH